MRTALHKL